MLGAKKAAQLARLLSNPMKEAVAAAVKPVAAPSTPIKPVEDIKPQIASVIKPVVSAEKEKEKRRSQFGVYNQSLS